MIAVIAIFDPRSSDAPGEKLKMKNVATEYCANKMKAKRKRKEKEKNELDLRCVW